MADCERLLSIVLTASLALATSALGGVSGASINGSVEDQSIADEQKLRLQLTEEAANRFIQRWHETVDIEVLFNEMFVSDPTQRRQNVYGLVNTSADNYKKFKRLEYAVVKDAFMAFLNMQYLDAEYQLAMSVGDEAAPIPPEIKRAEKRLRQRKERKDEEGRINTDALRQSTVWCNELSFLYRQYLRPNSFNSANYKSNAAKSAESGAPRVLLGVPQYGVANDREVYVLKRGVFQFCFIEEGGELKVLTLDLES